MKKVKVIKVGGAILENQSSLNSFLDRFANVEGNKILVHGGGRQATDMAKRLGVETLMIEGRRVTDDSMLEIVTMVYGGLVNKTVVAKLQQRGINSVGLTGADMNIVRSVKRPPKNGVDYGNVGDVTNVDGRLLEKLIEMGVVAVVAPLTHDGQGHILNTNADTIAAEVAKSLATSMDVTLIYCFEKSGVMTDPDEPSSVIEKITPSLFNELKSNGIITAGMIPKLENSFDALEKGVGKIRITSAENLEGGTLLTIE